MDPTATTIDAEAPFLELLTTCWSKARRSGRDGAMARLRELLTARLGQDGRIVDAVLVGLESLADYASATLDSGDAIAEEEAALEASRRAVRPVLEARLQQRLDALDASCAAVHGVECGARAQSQGQRSRSWLSGFGELRLSRRYCYCSHCQTGRAWAQERLGLGEFRHTPQLAEQITRLSTVVPYTMAVELTAQLVGAHVSVRGAERLVAERATSVAMTVAEEASMHDPFDDTGLQRRVTRPADAVSVAPGVAYLEMDGVFAMTRQEDLERREPTSPGARGGKGRRYDIVGREVKNAVLYTSADCATEGERRGCLLDKRYVSGRPAARRVDWRGRVAFGMGFYV